MIISQITLFKLSLQPAYQGKRSMVASATARRPNTGLSIQNLIVGDTPLSVNEVTYTFQVQPD
ncbi:MAG: hypothetical protein M3Y56_01315 [Armatimonadota bacterium]|nr:hypothetical protein [Armatimonadota bacterium]